MKPILFNAEMVKAILEGRKTVTRRTVKTQHKNACGFYICRNKAGEIVGVCDYDENEVMFDDYNNPPYKPGDVLYVRETWAYSSCANCDGDIDSGVCSKRENGEEPIGCYCYKADGDIKWDDGKTHWKPSIHMPKEAARIFLKVTDVRVERLQDITNAEAIKEGAETEEYLDMQEEAGVCGLSCQSIRDYFSAVIWDSTIQKKDLPLYRWEANPYVWVIEFERCEKSESEGL